LISFNDLLRAEDIDPATVKLVRHQEGGRRGQIIFATSRMPDGRAKVEEYQRIQHRTVFDVGGLIATFIVTPRGDTLFFGLYRVDGLGVCEPGTTDPIFNDPAGGKNRYDLTYDPRLAQYEGRLSIAWGGATRSWFQRAAKQPKPVVAIREPDDPPFPGFSSFVCDLEDVPGLYTSWQAILRAVKGIYLLVDRETGDQYVGSARGEESLLARWMTYAQNGHGGNVGLRPREGAKYQASVLQVFDITSPDQRIEEVEAWWKQKLGTRVHGLNLN
jgi:hypothetical protein